MNDNKYYEDILLARDIKPTPNRILVLKTLLSGDEMLSVSFCV